MTTKPLKTITVAELKHTLHSLLAMPDNTLVYLGAGDLTVVRTKTRQHATADSPAIVSIELVEEYEVTYTPGEDA